MANFLDVTNISYAGKEGRDIFSKSIFDLDIASYGIQIRTDIKNKEKLYSGTVGDVWQPYSCPFTPSGAVSLAEEYIEVVPIKVNMENCYDEFWGNWLSEQTRIDLSGGIPQTFFDWFFNDKLITTMKKQYQTLFWNGNKAKGTTPFLKLIDGVHAILENDKTSVTKIDGAAFTVDNILDQVKATVHAAITKARTEGVDMSEYKVLMNKFDVDLMMEALGNNCGCNLTTSNFSNYTKNGDSLSILGYEVVRTMQTASTVIMGPVNNIVLGCDVLDSKIAYKLIDLRETDGSNMFRVIAISNIGAAIVLKGLFVYSRVKPV